MVIWFFVLNPKYAIEITKLAKVITVWAFTNNHRLTFGLTCPTEMPLGCKFFANTHGTSTIANFGNAIA